MVKTSLLYKTLVVGVIGLFIRVGIQPAFATVQPEQEIDIEPKEYLFQTIIDIANNPKVKNLLEQYDNDMLKVDFDRSVYRKILRSNPRLFFNIIFTKPSMSIEYLYKCYNKGIEITNIPGEDKALEMIKSIEISNTEFLDELNNIITKDEKLSYRLATLKEMNKQLKQNLPWDNLPIICTILSLIAIPFYMMSLFFATLTLIFKEILLPLSIIFELGCGISYTIFGICLILIIDFQCIYIEPHIKQ